MKKIFTMLTLAWAPFCFSQVLLIPSPDRNFDIYKANCQKQGYTCTTNFFLEQVQKQETPQFDLLIDELDYSSKEFRDGLSDRILKVIKTEMISVEQVEILLKLLEQAQAFTEAKKNKPFQMIEKQLQENLRFVQNEEIKELPAEYLIILKKAVPSKAGQKLQTGFLKMKLEKIKYNRAVSSSDFLVQGDCKNEVLHPIVQNLKWQMDREKACGFTEQIGRVSSTTSDFISKNKTSLMTVGIVAVGAALLLNNYEIQFAF